MKYRFEGQGVVSLPGSKSFAIRSLIISSFLNQPLLLKNFPKCNDTLTLISALKALGFLFSFPKDSELLVTPPHTINLSPKIEIVDSAAALRFLLFRLSGIKEMQAEISLSPQLKKRPIEPLFDIIRSLGGIIEWSGETIIVKGTTPLTLTAKTKSLLTQYQQISSQFLSGLLLSSPLLQNDELSLTIPPSQVSLPYLDISLAIMRDFGLLYKREGDTLTLDKNVRVYKSPKVYTIEPDYSSACYFWALGALSANYVGVEVNKYCSVQGDFQFLSILEEMGAEVEYADGFISVKSGELKGIKRSMSDMPDQVPTLAVLALFAESTTQLYNIDFLRFKESDRIDSIIKGLSKLSPKSNYSKGVLTIYPLEKRPSKTTLNCYQDHRLVMAFSILSSIFPEVRIDDSSAVAKSFPNFFLELSKLTLLS
ncbi:MAG: 3-phosphoshikimate 1-carboxyvinyltransferase [Candidatus Cloacimonas sp.]|nr:3-phosphoshikimate 1-carboxyvinyltransferase [Candidatus Cloacimonadota bacterium]